MCTPSKVQIRTRLEVIGGRIAKIQSSRAKGAVLTVENAQIDEQDSLATVHLMPSREDKNVHVVISLKMKDNIYYPVVERDTVTKKVSMRLELKTKPLVEFSEKYLFKWDSTGQFGSLCSVEEPSQYLSVKDSIVILSSHRDQSFRIRQNNVISNRIAHSQPRSSNTHFINCTTKKIPLLPPRMYGGLKGSTKDFFREWQT